MAANSDPMLYVFDLDGTLADTAGDLIGTLDYIMVEEGFDITPIEDARSLLGAGARALSVGHWPSKAGTLHPSGSKNVCAFPGPLRRPHRRRQPALSRRGRGARRAGTARGVFAVCTNKVERPAKLLLEKLGVADRFAFICGQDTFGSPSPIPDRCSRPSRPRAEKSRARSWSAIPRPTSPPPAPPTFR